MFKGQEVKVEVTENGKKKVYNGYVLVITKWSYHVVVPVHLREVIFFDRKTMKSRYHPNTIRIQ